MRKKPNLDAAPELIFMVKALRPSAPTDAESGVAALLSTSAV